ncbi:TetR/AcrR family transcriptional regulator [Amycolatopsis acidiphila]|uniref:TetR/AcrR family transcriptional regulator n=1 Tax=Amycolatopsis acidiphila TaxID=715473 RepID=A0A558A4R6_9PSEU|nr:TetR/AcrR family transcriptional regulator [Amycolatopsis acidiphila]TVT19254.1 TetR/AcrR family transcriptional regulator [Amycolatopsis acidiphila]UIJ62320.1 TetR/AcrR family transcriptional regulator [Amycolatopsis acidiphila]GHG96857.1 TetR family transcriptional regulator [Amycolatopsis acidiphila]
MTTLRERILDAGVGLICTEGWDRVTMSQLAHHVGVSRQMVYKEVGARDTLARAIVTRHADRFLAGVTDQLRAHGEDIVAGVSAAVDYVLRAAADDPLLKAVLSAAHGGTQDLLPLLAIQPEPVLERAVHTVLREAGELYGGLGLPRLPELVEVVVRLTLSHLIQPFGPVEQASEQVAWLVRNALAAAAGGR